jgi:hypothetical protein
MFQLSSSTAASAMLPYLGPAGEYFADYRTFLGVAAITVSLLALVSPLWAIAGRYSTPSVIFLGVKKLGAFTAVGALVLAILSGPIALFADRSCAHDLTKILENEPVYYISK